MSPPAASADHYCLHKAVRPVAGPTAFKNGPFQLSSSRDGVEGPGRIDARTSFFLPRVPHGRVAIYPYFDLYSCTSAKFVHVFHIAVHNVQKCVKTTSNGVHHDEHPSLSVENVKSPYCSDRMAHTTKSLARVRPRSRTIRSINLKTSRKASPAVQRELHGAGEK